MNKEQQDKIWNDLSEESKESHRQFYEVYKDYKIESFHYHVCRQLEKTFGTHNLNPKPQIKTWEDVEKDGHYIGINVNTELNRIDMFANNVSLKIQNKIQATLKIAKLIELGYGGMVSEEEWGNNEIVKYYIVPTINGKNKDIKITGSYEYEDKHYIAFRTPEQREEFMSYESNIKLVEQYYMM